MVPRKREPIYMAVLERSATMGVIVAAAVSGVVPGSPICCRDCATDELRLRFGT